jgi:transcriptional regulator with XRE-family HTH domain
MPLPLTATQLRKLRATPVAASGNRLQFALDLAEITQVDLADRLGMTNTQVSDAARGRYETMRLDNAQKFAGAFGCLVDDLFPVRQGAVA